MVSSQEVLLIAINPDTESLTVPAQLLLHYETALSATVHTCLGGEAVQCTAMAYSKKAFPCVLDHQWDVWATSDAIYNGHLMENETLHSYAQDFNTPFEDINFELFETEAEFTDRVKKALFAQGSKAKVAVVHSNVVRLCLTLLGSEVKDDPPVFASLELWPASGRGRVQMSFDDWSEAEKFLSSPKSMLSTLPLATSILEASPVASHYGIPHSLLESRSSIPGRDVRKIESALEEQVTALSMTFSGEVRKAVVGAVEECRPRGPDPSEEVVAAVTQSLSQLHTRFLSDLNSLSTRLTAFDDFEPSQKREIEALIEDFRTAQQQQVEIEAMLTQTNETLKPLVDSLKGQLEGIAAQQRELQTEIEDAKVNKLTKGFPILIRAVELGEDSSYYAVITSRKFYDVHGLISVFQGNHLVMPTTYCKCSGEVRINLSNFPDLAPGTIEVAVAHFHDHREISRRVEITLSEGWRRPLRTYKDFEGSMVYQSVENAEQIEQEFERLGKGSAETVRRLAAGWRNEKPDQVDMFLQILLQEDLLNEAAIRRQMAEANIVIQT